MDSFFGVLRAKDRASCHQHICAGGEQLCRILRVHTAVNLDKRFQSSLVYLRADETYLIHRFGNEFLSSEACKHGHQQHHVHLVQIGHKTLDIDVGIDGQAGPYAFGFDEVENGHRVVHRLEMKTNRPRAGIAEPLHVFLGMNNHQMYVQRLVAIFVHRYHERKTEGNIRHKRTIHHIDMQPVRLAAVNHL